MGNVAGPGSEQLCGRAHCSWPVRNTGTTNRQGQRQPSARARGHWHGSRNPQATLHRGLRWQRSRQRSGGHRAEAGLGRRPGDAAAGPRAVCRSGPGDRTCSRSSSSPAKPGHARTCFLHASNRLSAEFGQAQMQPRYIVCLRPSTGRQRARERDPHPLPPGRSCGGCHRLPVAVTAVGAVGACTTARRS